MKWGGRMLTDWAKSNTLASCSHTTIMSKVPMPEDLFKHIKSLLNMIPKEIKAYCKYSKTSPELIKQLLIKFTTNSIIKSLLNAPES